MKYGNWKGLVIAIAGFALLGIGLDKHSQPTIFFGAALMISWLGYVFYSYITSGQKRH